MPEPTQFTFELGEVATTLVKEQGLHEGLWALAFEMNVSIGTMGASSAEAKPGVLVQIAKVQLVRQTEARPGAIHVVDAALVNPASKQTKPQRRRARSK